MQKVLAVELHPSARVLRGVDAEALKKSLTGAMLHGSEAHGKRLFFKFSNDGWLSLHMGMSGSLTAQKADAEIGRHDHLVLRQAKQCLFFTDPRQLGHVRFHAGETPSWMASLPPPVLSPKFTRPRMDKFLARHGRQPVKASLLMQEGFPGIGNWMADEILWRARLQPSMRSDSLSASEAGKLYREARFVAREAMRTIGERLGDPPASWLFHHRWRAGGLCPRDKSKLERAQVGGRTSCWCGNCQK